MKVWIGNLKQGTTAERVEQLLLKYGLPQPQRMLPVLDGDAPAMLLEFQTDDEQRLRSLLWRIEGLYWEGSRLTVAPLHFR